MHQEWIESINTYLPKSDKTGCSKYRSTSLLSNAYKILSNIFLSSLTTYEEEFIVGHRGAFQRKGSTTSHTFLFAKYLRKSAVQRGRA